MESDYRTARRLVTDIRDKLTSLETGTDTSADLQGSLSSDMNSLNRLIHVLERAVAAPAPGSDAALSSNPELWKRRITGLSDEATLLRQSLVKYFDESKARHDREALFSQKTGSGGSSARNPALSKYRALEGERTSIFHSNRILDDMLSAGSSVLNMLRTQRATLSSAGQRAHDIASQLTMGDNLMNMIRRRQAGDRAIVYAGMVLTTLLLLLIYVYIL